MKKINQSFFTCSVCAFESRAITLKITSYKWDGVAKNINCNCRQRDHLNR